jgi:site-specific DNA-methyltransferase (adenine-specific)
MFPSAPGQLASSSSSSETRKNQNCYGDMRRGSPDAVMEPRRESDTSAARFFNSFPLDTDPLFYCAKASKADRAGSRHPTVKPITLMRWLCRLVTPPGGTVLDPFAGSGTTGAAALAEGLNCLLIEAYDDYAADIRRRFAIPAPVNDDIDALIGGGIESLIG